MLLTLQSMQHAFVPPLTASFNTRPHSSLPHLIPHARPFRAPPSPLQWLTASWGFPDHWSRQGGCEAYRSALETRIKRDVAAFRWDWAGGLALLCHCVVLMRLVRFAFRWAGVD